MSNENSHIFYVNRFHPLTRNRILKMIMVLKLRVFDFITRSDQTVIIITSWRKCIKSWHTSRIYISPVCLSLGAEYVCLWYLISKWKIWLFYGSWELPMLADGIFEARYWPKGPYYFYYYNSLSNIYKITSIRCFALTWTTNKHPFTITLHWSNQFKNK